MNRTGECWQWLAASARPPSRIFFLHATSRLSEGNEAFCQDSTGKTLFLLLQTTPKLALFTALCAAVSPAYMCLSSLYPRIPSWGSIWSGCSNGSTRTW